MAKKILNLDENTSALARLVVAGKVNVAKLDQELRDAGIAIDGVACDGTGAVRVDFGPTATDADKGRAQGVVSSHKPDPTAMQKLCASGRDPLLIALCCVAMQGAAAPQWAKDMVQEAVDFAATV